MAGQDWLEKDFYATLGVSKDADQAAIKKAYRKLARTHHPDQNPGDAKAEAKFKEIAEAYAVLSDAEERKQYDGLRAMATGGPRFTPGSGRGGSGFEDMFGGAFPSGGQGGNVRFNTTGSGGAGFEDLLSGLFGGGGGAQRGGRSAGFSPNASRAGADIEARTTLDFRQAVEGAQVSLSLNGRTINARVPAGVRSGQKIKIPGKGQPGQGGPAGDLLLTVDVTPDPVFTMDGNNLRITVPVTFPEAALGGKISVPTFDGGTVTLKVPAGTPSGRVLRVKGRGVHAKSGTGDLLVTVEVAVPSRLSSEAKAAVEAFAEATGDIDIRADLLNQAAR